MFIMFFQLAGNISLVKNRFNVFYQMLIEVSEKKQQSQALKHY